MTAEPQNDDDVVALTIAEERATGADAPVAHLLAGATRLLDAHGSLSPRLDGEVLLAHALDVERAWLSAHPQHVLDAMQRRTFDVFVERRSRGEPVAYITGRRSWYDLELEVTPDVLVPRPETEGLLERALAWARGRTVAAVADIGTGSGALAIALARALPATRLYAVDISAAALTVARRNALRHDVSARITFLSGDLLRPLVEPVDLLVANLPYIGEEEFETVARDVREFEPRVALVGGAEGHEALARLLARAPKRLNPGGAIFLELGPPQAGAAITAARHAFPGAEVRLECDYAGLTRYLTILT